MGRRSDARTRLVRVARDAFWTRSCVGVSVDTLCREAGVNKGSFYHYFASKQAIVIETLDGYWREIREQVIEPAFDPGLPPLERIRQLFLRHHALQSAAHAETGRVPGCPFLNMGAEMSAHDAEVRERVGEILRRQVAYIESALREAADAGEFLGDPGPAARCVYASLAGFLMQARIGNRPAIIAEGADNALACLAARPAELAG